MADSRLNDPRSDREVTAPIVVSCGCPDCWAALQPVRLEPEWDTWRYVMRRMTLARAVEFAALIESVPE